MLEIVREFCLSLPGVTEKVQWEEDLLFCIGGKMFAVTPLNHIGPTRLSFKAAPEIFAELTERQGFIPAPYLARAQWVALTEWDALPPDELRQHLSAAYELILAKLPKKTRAALALTTAAPARASE